MSSKRKDERSTAYVLCGVQLPMVFITTHLTEDNSLKSLKKFNTGLLRAKKVNKF